MRTIPSTIVYHHDILPSVKTRIAAIDACDECATHVGTPQQGTYHPIPSRSTEGPPLRSALSYWVTNVKLRPASSNAAQRSFVG